jgi:hypothetical protein
MKDWLDDALGMLPGEPLSSDLVDRILVRLKARRRARRRLELAARTALAGAGVLGAWLVAMRLEGVWVRMTAAPGIVLEGGLGGLVSSPLYSAVSLGLQVVAWLGLLGSILEPAFALALALLAGSALYGLASAAGSPAAWKGAGR